MINEKLDGIVANLEAMFSPNKASIFAPRTESHGTRVMMATEECIYWMRKITDELIMVCYLTAHWEVSGEFPKSVSDVDCIGDLLDKTKGVSDDKKNFLRKQFSVHLDFLHDFNELFNTYKHSIHNSDGDCAFSINDVIINYIPSRNKAGEPDVKVMLLSHIVHGFDSFYRDADAYIRSVHKAPSE